MLSRKCLFTYGYVNILHFIFTSNINPLRKVYFHEQRFLFAPSYSFYTLFLCTFIKTFGCSVSLTFSASFTALTGFLFWQITPFHFIKLLSKIWPLKPMSWLSSQPDTTHYRYQRPLPWLCAFIRSLCVRIYYSLSYLANLSS